ncbi:MAG: hypothetical protein PHG82_03335 [Candidatus Gracilibacteria bacterium]|nr:hypothetical protein [Candidatus Gracilibacteria bacterium]
MLTEGFSHKNFSENQQIVVDFLNILRTFRKNIKTKEIENIADETKRIIIDTNNEKFIEDRDGDAVMLNTNLVNDFIEKEAEKVSKKVAIGIFQYYMKIKNNREKLNTLAEKLKEASNDTDLNLEKLTQILNYCEIQEGILSTTKDIETILLAA